MQKYYRPHGGFTSVAAVLLLTLIGLVAAFHYSKSQESIRQARGERIGTEIARLRDTAQSFVDRYAVDIKKSFLQASALATFDLGRALDKEAVVSIDVRKESDTVATLAPDALKGVFAWMNVRGVTHDTARTGQYRLQLRLKTSGNGDDSVACSVSNLSQCGIELMVYLDTPIAERNGSFDPLVMQAALAKIGDGGGASYPLSEATIRFQGGETLPNPVSERTSGILAAKGVSTGSADYMPLTGGKFRGDLDMGQQPINQIKKMAVGDLHIEDSTIRTGTSFTIEAPETRFKNHDGKYIGKFSEGQLTSERIHAGSIAIGDKIEFAADATAVACSQPKLSVNIDGEPIFCNGSEWVRLKGDAGQNGKTGEKGLPGKVGQRGDKGADGANGIAGERGPSGDIHFLVEPTTYTVVERKTSWKATSKTGAFDWGDRTNEHDLGQWISCRLVNIGDVDNDKISLTVDERNKWRLKATKKWGGSPTSIDTECYDLKVWRSGHAEKFASDVSFGSWISF